jgi:hypothetical protein
MLVYGLVITSFNYQFYTVSIKTLKRIYSMKTQTAPVLLHIFNRPQMVINLLKQIRQAQPAKLYISSDGPRPGRAGERELCMENRNIIDQIDWDCEVKTLFHDNNLGTRYALVTAISWFFENEEEGIVLEEDCLPNQSFFRFCTNMLEHYRNDPRIMHITGVNQQFGKKIGDASYYFSNFPSIWGWAGWRRVWQLYDVKMSLFPKFESENVLSNVFSDPVVVKYGNGLLRQTYENKNMTWDHQLAFTIIINNGLCVVPNVNLVSNIGVKKVGKDQLDSIVGNIPTVEIEQEITHPAFFIPDKKADLNQMTWTYEDTTTSKKVFYNKKPRFHSIRTIVNSFKARLSKA